jgi:hypothetical protein
MHHSGTSILARILHENGVFMQANMRHYESKFFTIQINERMILGDEAGWAQIPMMPVDEVLQHTDAVRRVVAKKSWRKYREAGYDGFSRWGFKDPRTCVLLPLYMEIFPCAQYVHIIRNADAVATSLAENNKKGVGIKSDRAFWKNLWQQYTDRAREYGRKSEGYLEITYEAFCTRPVDVVQEVFAFLDVEFTEKTRGFLQEKIYTHRINIG